MLRIGRKEGKIPQQRCCLIYRAATAATQQYLPENKFPPQRDSLADAMSLLNNYPQLRYAQRPFLSISSGTPNGRLLCRDTSSLFDVFAYTMHVIGRQAGLCETRWIHWSGQPQRRVSKHVVDTLDDDERATISLFPKIASGSRTYARHMQSYVRIVSYAEHKSLIIV